MQGRSKDAIKGMYLIPSNLNINDKVEHMQRYYGYDLPNEDGLIQEITLWNQFWKKKNQNNRKQSQQYWNI